MNTCHLLLHYKFSPVCEGLLYDGLYFTIQVIHSIEYLTI